MSQNRIRKDVLAICVVLLIVQLAGGAFFILRSDYAGLRNQIAATAPFVVLSGFAILNAKWARWARWLLAFLLVSGGFIGSYLAGQTLYREIENSAPFLVLGLPGPSLLALVFLVLMIFLLIGGIYMFITLKKKQSNNQISQEFKKTKIH